jgi:hypothetical protein
MAGVYHCGGIADFRLQIVDLQIENGSSRSSKSEIYNLQSEIPMTAKDFRQLALALPETEERAHMNHPDFRVGGKVFATLGYPDKSSGMVKLSPEDQHHFSKEYPDVFTPVKGAWGLRGATCVHLKAAKKEALSKALQAAWRNTAPKRLLANESKSKTKTNKN